MPRAPIPFTNRQESGFDELAGSSPVAINVVDANGVLRRRPGLTAYEGATTGVIDANGLSALYITKSGEVYAVSAAGAERPIYHVTPSASIALSDGVNAPGAPNAGLRGARRPVMAETELLLVLSGGDAMQKIELLSNISTRLAGSPPISSHVIANASRLLANDLTVSPTNVRFSDVASGNTDFSGHEVWTLGVGTAGFFSKEAKPDPVVALAENSNEVFVFGSETSQVFQPDPSLTYALSATREIGCSAPYSVVKADEVFFWLDHYGRFVQSDGRSFNVISDAIQKTLDDMTVRSDCFGYRVVEGFVDAIVWTFPADGRTFAFEKGAGWGEWQGYNPATSNWKQFAVTAAAKPPDSSEVIVALTTGEIRKLSFESAVDGTDPVAASVETGYQNRETDALKMCKVVFLALRRGTTSSADGPVAWLSFRDQPGPWTRIPVSLGASGDTDPVVALRGLGMYRRRQWKFEFSGSEALSLVSATEDFEVLAA